MSENRASGIYVIDSEYNILYYNQRAKEIYPMLQCQKKCYKILMNNEQPCDRCPVNNKVKGPSTFIDPIRRIAETVDAVEMSFGEGKNGYGIILNMVPYESKITDVGSNKRRKILVVEDNELNREMLQSILEDEYDIIKAVDGKDGLDLLYTHYRDISVILLDLMMPNCNGFEFMRRMKGNILFSSIPIIVMSSVTEKAAEEECLELGAIDFLRKPYEPVIVKSRLKNIIRMKESASSLSLIETDDLTGLYTRQAFLHHARRLIDVNPEDSFDIYISDIENFKHINGVYGENKGDEILKSLADYVKSYTGNGICARYGADLFISIRKSSKVHVKEDIKAMVTPAVQHFVSSAPVPNLVVKTGIYQNVDRTLPIVQMCDRALLALKSIKGNHNMDVAFFDGPVSQRLLQSQQYEADFQEALRQKEFVIFYQPKYDTFSEKVVGAEALVRWNHNGMMMPPGEFLSVFEGDGMITQLDEYVFRTVCEQQRKWKEGGRDIVPISVNLSRKSMFQLDVVQRYKEIVEENGISPSDVPIEITESAAVSGLEIKPLADVFYQAGFSLHLDDFGSGRSSLNDLNMLHFDVVKIDKSLIDYIGDERGELLLTYTMALGKKLELNLVAEGVEEECQRDFLRANGCDAVQGYFYSKPLPLEKFEQVLFPEDKITEK